jgi:hypothetical protein
VPIMVPSSEPRVGANNRKKQLRNVSKPHILVLMLVGRGILRIAFPQCSVEEAEPRELLRQVSPKWMDLHGPKGSTRWQEVPRMRR